MLGSWLRWPPAVAVDGRPGLCGRGPGGSEASALPLLRVCAASCEASECALRSACQPATHRHVAWICAERWSGTCTGSGVILWLQPGPKQHRCSRAALFDLIVTGVEEGRAASLLQDALSPGEWHRQLCVQRILAIRDQSFRFSPPRPACAAALCTGPSRTEEERGILVALK